MKNVIMFIIDSVFSDCLSNNKTEVSSTPFLDNVIAKGVFAPNVYSFGPYTDSATKGLYCGQPTLSDYGFYYSINGSKHNHYSVFKENGYKTIGLYYPYYLLSSKVEKNIDVSIYTSGFLYESVWFGKYKYYSEKESLSDFDYKVLIKFTDMLFDCWMTFYNNYNSNSISSSIIKRLKTNENGFKALQIEKEQYEQDKQRYVGNILRLKMDHPLASINDFDFSRNVNIPLMKEVFIKHKLFLNEVYRLNKKCNKRKGRLLKNLKEAFLYLTTRKDSHLRYLMNDYLLFSSTKLMRKRALGGKWQLEASAGKQVDSLIEVLTKQKDQSPFFATLHVEEPHHNVNFFSFDAENIERINQEIEYLKPLVDNPGKNFKGNLLYQMSLRYVDYCLKRLFTGLEDIGLLDDTIILITADHGSSYYSYPLRDSVTNNFFKENYKIPLIIYGKQIKPAIYNGLYDSSSILPSLLDYAGIKNSYFLSKSICSFKDGLGSIITEYTGPGCPDLTSREIWIAGRSEKYTIAYKNRLFEDFKVNKPVELYNEQIDGEELNNIVSSFDSLSTDESLKSLVLKVEQRFIDIRNETKNIIEHFDEFNVV